MAIEAMKIYLDNCTLQRPLDDKSQMRIRLEAEAILSVLELCKAGEMDLLSSEALELEIEKNPLATRRNYAESALESANAHIMLDEGIELRAHEFLKLGINRLTHYILPARKPPMLIIFVHVMIDFCGVQRQSMI